MDGLFDTDSKKTNAVLHFKALEANQGWQLVVKIVKENLKVLEKQLKDGAEGQTIEDVNRLRDKIKDHENFITTPERMITLLENPVTGNPDDTDPYE